MGLGLDRILNLAMIPLQMYQEDQARRANEKRYGQLIKGGLGAIGVPNDTAPEDIARVAGADVTALDRQNADLLAGADADTKQQLADFDAGAGKLRGLQEADRGRLMSYLDQYGNQELADAERLANERNAQTSSRLRALGLSGTSIATSAGRGMYREKSDQLRRINENIASTKFNADMALSSQNQALEGNLISGRQALSANLSSRNLGLRDDVASRRFDFADRTINRMANVVEGRTDAYPDQGVYLGLQQALGQSAGNRAYLDSVKNNWAGSIFGPAAGTAAGTAAGVATAAALAPATGFATTPLAVLSDRRAKKNIKTVGKLKDGLKLRSYNYKGEQPGALKRVGVIAQDVEKKHPDLVVTGADGMKRVNYGGLKRRMAG